MINATPVIESGDTIGECGRRPSEETARAAIENFLADELGLSLDFHVVPDGNRDSAPNKCGWAFWLLSGHPTSYLHEDLTVEWYGTSWGQDSTPAP